MLCLTALLTACSQGAPPALTPVTLPTEMPTVEQAASTPVESHQPTLAPTVDIPPASIAYAGPAWASLPLTNAHTGEIFTLADFAGKTLYVETMATWCPPCRTQLINVNQAHAQVNQDEFTFVVLSLAETISNEDLVRYANDNGFSMTFALTTPELLDALVTAFGFSVSNPPSTPHFTISPIGTVSSLHTGLSGPDSLVAELVQASAV
jgi:thiol-disulfide isomerase/thioredoxin